MIFVATVAAIIAATPAAAAEKKPSADQLPPFPPTVVEPDGRISEKITPELLAGIVFLVRHKGGYKCDTVRYAYPFFVGVGVHLVCNGGLYKYEITQPGGEWLVVAK